ncbi:MAG: NADPH-dependent F420 reductase [Myxococcota bacterium]
MADREPVAILGGTGDQGLGLAYRFAAAGRKVTIGSRKLERATAAAREVLERVPGADISGLENAAAVREVAGAIAILSVPFEHTVSTLRALREVLSPGTLLVSMGVPLATAIGDVAGRTLGISQGSCAELCASLVPSGVEVASAFQNVSAHRLLDLEHEVECDVLVSGPKAARTRAMALCGDLPGTRAVDAGPLYNARYVEQLTALLIGLNVRHRNREGFGIRITYL